MTQDGADEIAQLNQTIRSVCFGRRNSTIILVLIQVHAHPCNLLHVISLVCFQRGMHLEGKTGAIPLAC